jgi:class 3 adenylate cyclase
MGLPRTERKLAAILAADVVGYSRLMGIAAASSRPPATVCWSNSPA